MSGSGPAFARVPGLLFLGRAGFPDAVPRFSLFRPEFPGILEKTRCTRGGGRVNKTELLDRCARSGGGAHPAGPGAGQAGAGPEPGRPRPHPLPDPGEQASAADLLTAWGNPRYAAFGGYEGSERNILYFPPDWQEPEDASPTRRAPWPPWRGHSQTGPPSPTGTFWVPHGPGHHPGEAGGHFDVRGEVPGGRPAGGPAHPPEPVGVRRPVEGVGGGDPPLRPHPQAPPPSRPSGTRCPPAAGRGAGGGLLHLPVQSGGPHLRRAGVHQPPGVHEGGPDGE